MKRTAWFWIATQFFLLPILPQPSTSASPKDEATPPRFVCDTGYTLEKCNEDMAVLRAALAKYPVAQLGNWTWVLVRSQDWKAILLPRGLNPDSPAFSYLEKRVTFIEESLVAEVPLRRHDLLLKWRMSIGDLLDFSIAHELAHALCGEKDEAKTIEVAKSLQKRKSFSCKTNPAAKLQARHMKYDNASARGGTPRFLSRHQIPSGTRFRFLLTFHRLHSPPFGRNHVHLRPDRIQRRQP